MLRLLGLSRDDSSKPLPADRLQVKHLASGKAVFQAHAGVPVTSDSLAYEPVQRLIAVATTDGRIKIVGSDGVERALYSSGCANCTPAATRQLLFLINRGGLVRLGQDGLLELFAVDPSSSNSDDPSQPLAHLSIPDDPVCCMAALQQEPYLLLGCTSGAVRVAALVNASGEAVNATRQVRGLALLPYTVSARKLDASGAVTALTVQSEPPYQHLLVLHEESGAAIWDLRAQVLVATVGAGASSSSSGVKAHGLSALHHGSGRITAAEWLHGSSRGDFATGHANGDINIWSLVESCSNGSGSSNRDWREGRKSTAGQQLQQPLLVSQLRVAAAAAASTSTSLHQQRSVSPERRKQKRQIPDMSRQKCRPVQSLQYVSMGHAEGLLVFGGGEDVQPDGLLLLPLPEPQLDVGVEDTTSQEEQQQTLAAAALKLPWIGFILGHALVPNQGALTGYEEPSAVLVLAESGEIIMHDISAFAASASRAVVASESAAAAGSDGRQQRSSSSSSSPTRYKQRSPRSSSPAALRAALGSGDGSSFTTPLRKSSTAASHADAVAAAAPQRLFTQLLQGQPLVTAARLRLIPIERVPLQGLQGACMVSLNDWAARNAAAAAKNPEAVSSKWVVAGGKVAPPPRHSSGGGSTAAGSADHDHSRSSSSSTYATLYCTGHSDGGVRLWAMHGEAPLLLGTAPSAAALEALRSSSSSKAAPVSTLEFAWEQGLLISGHEGGEVHMYQFSKTPKRLECVLFESVGSRSNNEAIIIDEPAGFQLRLLTRLHSADIVSSAYLPQFKMVAVSDRSGSVSLIDLARPAVPWFQAPWNNQPVVSLALGNVPMPPSRERHAALAASATQKVAAGAAVCAVVAVAADSQMAVMDAATGFFLSRNGILTPKHTSPALHVELLDTNGAPTWMSRDVQGLIDLARERQQEQRDRSASPANAARGRDAQLAGSSASAGTDRLESPVSAAAWEEHNNQATGQQSEGDGSESGQEEEPDVDENELLEKAAAEIEAEESKAVSRKKRHNKQKQQQQQPDSADYEAGQQHHRSPSKQRHSSPSQQRHRSPSKQRDSEASGAKLGLKPLGASTGSLAGADTSSSTAASKPIVLSEPMAGYVLVATQHYLRIYPVSHAVSGDRTTCKRLSLAGPLQFASTFAAAGAPALVCLLELEGEVHMQVYTLPRLELIKGMPLSSLLGWKWTWDPKHTAPAGSGVSRVSSQAITASDYDPYSANIQQQQQQFEDEDAAAAAAAAAVKAAAMAAGLAAASSRLASVCAATRHGHLALVGPGSELVRLALAAEAAGAPMPPQSVYDWDLATAAHAAGAAMERQQQQAWAIAAAAAASKRSAGDSSGGRSSVASGIAAGVEQEGQSMPPAAADGVNNAGSSSSSSNLVGGGGGSGGGAAGNKIDLKGFMTKIGGDMKRAGDEVKRGLKTALDETQKGLQKVAQVIETELTLKPGQQQLPEYPHPPLSVVFGAPAPGEAAGKKSSTVAAAAALLAKSPTAAPTVAATAAAGGRPLTPKAAAAATAAPGPATDGVDRVGSPGSPTAVLEISPPRVPKSPFQRANAAVVAPTSAATKSEGVFARRSSVDLGFRRSRNVSARSQSAMPATLDMVAAAAIAANNSTSPNRSRSPAPAVLDEAAARASPFASDSTGGGGGLRRSSPAPGQQPAAGPALPPSNPTSLIGGAIYRQQSGGLGAFSSGAAGGGSRVRTADEIRQAYGRPQLKAANDTRGVMEETKMALAQRGERLSRLQEQTADLADSAAGFAELAKQLAEKEKAKAKWFG